MKAGQSICFRFLERRPRAVAHEMDGRASRV
jgi:hypothetical protein